MSESLDLLLSQIGLRITQRRQDLGLTQRALAKRLDIAPANLSRVELGDRNVTMRTLWRVAEALDTTVLELMGGPPPSR